MRVCVCVCVKAKIQHWEEMSENVESCQGQAKQFLLVPFYGKKKQMPQNDVEGVICNLHIDLSLT